MEGYATPQFVGIDLHRRRSVIVRMTGEGEVLEAVRISNGVDQLTGVLERAGQSPEVRTPDMSRKFVWGQVRFLIS